MTVGRLGRLLPDLGDLRIIRLGFDKPVDVDRPHPLRESDVLLGRQSLVAEEENAMLVKCLANVGNGFDIQRLGKIEAL